MTTTHSPRYLSPRDRQVLEHLLSIADSDGKLTGSTYSIACQLGLHRQTLSRILSRLSRNGAVTLSDHSCTPVHVTKETSHPVTIPVTIPVTSPVTPSKFTFMMMDVKDVTILWTITYVVPATHGVEPVMTSPVTTSVTPVTPKKETKEKNEEFPPAPPIEEKKQKKEKISTTQTRACEKISTRSDEERLDMRRQRFIDSLQPFKERYGEEMISLFAEYWTESNRSNTKMRFELERTWNTSLRLARWARNDNAFTNSFTNNHNSHDHIYANYHNPYRRPTSEDYIREAEERAIAETEQFIREAEIRRGGVPPHLPF